ncbi:MAG: hypothetical protein MR598_01295 [Erysipelotrichaceae bacterium]|nr:hypothetical protein [Erysipelotrichaceae bacterium]
MDLIVKKFIDYLEEYVENFVKNQGKLVYAQGRENELTAGKVVKKVVIVKNLIHYFSNERQDMGIVFNDFFVLSTFLLQSPLSIEEQIKIIFYLCKRNLSLYYSKSSIVIYDLKKIEKLRFKKMGLTDAELCWFDSIFPNVFCCDDQFLTKEARKTKEALMENPQLYTVDNQDIFDNSIVIQHCYLDKMDSYTKQDVEKIMMVLKKLEVNNELCQKIRNFLLKDITRRLGQEKLGNTQIQRQSQLEFKKVEFQAVLNKNRMNYEEIYFELENVVDLRDMSAKCALSLEQTIYYISLLLCIKVERSRIQIFLKNVEIENNRILSHPVALYLELYDKLKYYEDRLVLFESMKLLEDYFQEMFIASDEEYEFWKLNFYQELNHYMKEIPGSFDYEFNMAMKRLEKKKIL